MQVWETADFWHTHYTPFPSLGVWIWSVETGFLVLQQQITSNTDLLLAKVSQHITLKPHTHNKAVKLFCIDCKTLSGNKSAIPTWKCVWGITVIYCCRENMARSVAALHNLHVKGTIAYPPTPVHSLATSSQIQEESMSDYKEQNFHFFYS